MKHIYTLRTEHTCTQGTYAEVLYGGRLLRDGTPAILRYYRGQCVHYITWNADTGQWASHTLNNLLYCQMIANLLYCQMIAEEFQRRDPYYRQLRESTVSIARRMFQVTPLPCLSDPVYMEE